MQATVSQLKHDPISIVAPDDVETHKRLAERIGAQKWLWDDRTRLAPAHYYTYVYANPNNMTFDLGPDWGFMTVADVVPGWRGKIFTAAWDRNLYRNPTLFRTAARAAVEARDLYVLDAFTAEPNTLARRFALKCGMTFRALLPRAACYNGVVMDIAWYEITRDDLGASPFDLVSTARS